MFLQRFAQVARCNSRTAGRSHAVCNPDGQSLSLSLRMQQQHMLAISSVAVSTYGSLVEVAENSTIWYVVPSALSGWSADYGDFPVGLGEQFANLISR